MRYLVLFLVVAALGCHSIPHPRFPDYNIFGERLCQKMHPAECATPMKRKATS